MEFFMELSDIVFGQTTITEPVLQELLLSPELNRLKHISSAGYYPAVPGFRHEQVNRFVHSVGVFMLLRRFGAPLEEQIAGLLHDVSHSAFSHTIDYIKKDAENQKVQGEQDKVHESFVKNSSLAPILQKHGFDVDYILDDSHFPLKENELPDICADRLDYTLRQALVFQCLKQEQIEHIITSLTVYDSSFVFSSPEAALHYANAFVWLNENCWSGLASAVMFSVSAQLFRRAIEQGFVNFSDFYKHDDDYVINQIKEHLRQDSKLQYYYSLLQMEPERFANYANDDIEPVFIKNRIVDPLVCIRNGCVRLSDLSKSYKDKITRQPKFKEYRIAPKISAAQAV